MVNVHHEPNFVLADRERYLFEFLQKAKLLCLVRSTCGRIGWISSEMVELLGHGDDLVGSPLENWLSFLPFEEREICRERHRKAIAGLDTQHEFSLVSETGQLVSVVSRMVHIESSVGKVAEVFIRHCTRNHESQNRIVSDRQVFHVPAANMASLMTSISHEFRNPMTGLLGYSQLLLEEVADKPVAFDYANMNRKSAESIVKLIESIIEIASLEFDSVQNYPRYISLVEVIRPVLERHLCEAERQGIYFQVEWPQDDYVFIDPDILTSIVQNLVENAIKFTRNGGVVVRFKVAQNTLRIQVKDSGIGIDSAALKHIFERYWQESEGISKRFKGIGVGLAIVKGYVELLKGGIQIDSKKGEGTIVHVEIPMLQNSDEVNIVEFTQSKRILYVEDDPIVQLLSRRILKDYLIDMCFTGEEALERIKSVNYDAFIIDIQLGKGMTGQDLAKVIRQMQKYKNVPIAAATALNYELALESDDVLFSHYLRKPFNQKEMLGLVSAMIEVRK